MKHISSKLILLFLVSAIIPLIVSYGFSIYQLKQATQRSVMQGNLEIAKIAALDIDRYFDSTRRILLNLSSQLSEIELTLEEKDRVLKNAFLDYKYFQDLKFVDLSGSVLATSNLKADLTPVDLKPILPQVLDKQVYVSPIYIATSPPPVRPAIQVAYPVKHAGKLEGILLSEINLIYMWHLVQKIKIGKEGTVTLIDPNGEVVASSNLTLLFELKPLPHFDAIGPKIVSEPQTTFVYERAGKDTLLASASLSGALKGSVLIEQPTAEAFSIARQLTRQVIAAAAFIAIFMSAVGAWGVRREILSHLKVLTAGIRRIGQGEWSHRVQIQSKDEFRLLGETINQMAGELEAQAGQIRRQERLSLIGRISGGLVHDLKHPIQNIRNWIRLLATHYNDEQYRKDFQDVVQREFQNVDIFFSNLKDLTGDMPFNPQPLPARELFKQIEERFLLDAQNRGVKITSEIQPEGLVLKADLFLITRVLSNLITNALQAIPKDGEIHLKAAPSGNRISISVADTGSGIPADRLASIFDDFTTTKRKGLGLGLALSRKIIEQHGGEIQVTSTPGKGTRFEILIPA